MIQLTMIWYHAIRYNTTQNEYSRKQCDTNQYDMVLYRDGGKIDSHKNHDSIHPQFWVDS